MSLVLFHLEDVTHEQIEIVHNALKRDNINKKWIYNCILKC